MSRKARLAVLVSGGGSNLQAIIDACQQNNLNAEVAVVVSNRDKIYALERAKKHNIETIVALPKDFPDKTIYSQYIADELKKRNIDLVCLAGYLLKLEPNFIRSFKGRIINIHPALLPKFGGDGMYGHFVHEAVLKAKEKESGPTVHFVDEVYDNGEIILQAKVPVLPNDTPDTLAKRVLEQEHKIYPEAIKIVLSKLGF